MAYLAFARKYRPKDFSEVIGQQGIVKRLKESIATNRIHHAFLFSGPRGVGKTSLARILAKALNCQSFDKPTVEPCGNCRSCQEIQSGNSLDVIEIDGASNRGIDEIRQLRENVKFAPSFCRFKIYIIDEVHQITHDAFNALLKTLEEPPTHVKFIFATTAPQKVPLTILSRCQRFNFRLLTGGEIIEKLDFIAKNENIPVDKELFKYIASASQGSIRDAESIFDQVAPLLIEGTEFSQILDILGQIPQEQINSFVGYLINKETCKSLEIINSIIEEGRNLNNFITAVFEYIRNIMLAKLGENLLAQVADLPQDLHKKIVDFSKITTMSYLLKVVDLFIEAKKVSKFLPSLRIPLEVAVVKLTYREKAPLEVRPSKEAEEKVSSREVKENGKNFGFQHKTASLNLKNVSKFVDSLKAGFRNKSGDKKEAQNKNMEILDVKVEEVSNIWQEVIENISKKKMAVATYLKEAKLLEVEGGIVIFGFPKKLKFHKEFLEKKDNKQFVEEALSTSLNNKLGVRYKLIDIEVNEAEKIDSSKQAINKIIDTFGGEILT